MKLKIRNWEKFQHYKDRSPPWIKLHRGLIDDINYHKLSGDAAKILPLLWIVGSEKDGMLPPLDELSYRVRYAESEVIAWVDELIDCGFIDDSAEQHAPQLLRTQHPRERSGFGNRYISKIIKEIVFERDGGKCTHCNSTENLEFDHIMPTSKGGESIENNLQLLCRSCNRRKRTKTSVEHVATTNRSLETEGETYRKEVEKKKEKVKKEKLDSEKTFLPPDWVDAQDWDDYEEMRKKIRKPMTDRAKELAIKTLDDLRKQGFDPSEVLKSSIQNSYQGLFETKGKSNVKSGIYQKPNGNDAASNAASAAERIIAARTALAGTIVGGVDGSAKPTHDPAFPGLRSPGYLRRQSADDGDERSDIPNGSGKIPIQPDQSGVPEVLGDGARPSDPIGHSENHGASAGKIE